MEIIFNGISSIDIGFTIPKENLEDDEVAKFITKLEAKIQDALITLAENPVESPFYHYLWISLGRNKVKGFYKFFREFCKENEIYFNEQESLGYQAKLNKVIAVLEDKEK